MRQLITFSLLFLCSACFTSDTSEGDSSGKAVTAKSDLVVKDSFQLYRDSLDAIEKISLKKDSMSFMQLFDVRDSFNLIYHEYGKTETGTQSYSVSIHSLSNTKIRVRLLLKQSEAWQAIDSITLQDIKFSPAYFTPHYDDYNQDGLNDIYLVFYNSMSVAYSYGHLILISKEEGRLIPVKESLNIPNLFVENGKIESVTYNHPGHETTKYRKTNYYKLDEDELVLIDSKKELL